jgi:threonine dehydratase
LEQIDYLQMILTSKVYDIAIETPLTVMPRLSERAGGTILLKREDMQPVFSFKLRGAYNMIAHLSDAERAQGVITASAGNHAQGVAMSARHLGCRAVIVMPTVTPSIKVNSVKRLGAEVVLIGDNFDEASAYAKRRAADDAMVYVPPFDHPLVIAGQVHTTDTNPSTTPLHTWVLHA